MTFFSSRICFDLKYVQENSYLIHILGILPDNKDTVRARFDHPLE